VDAYAGIQQGFRPWEQQGVLGFTAQVYGHSAQGTPLEIYGNCSPGGLLLIAGIHGEESDTTLVASRALRLLKSPPPNGIILCANPDGNRLGTRGNSRGVDLNRNFPTGNWTAAETLCRLTLETSRVTRLSPGETPASEPETRALIDLILQIRPTRIIALHSPLNCVDAADTPWARHIAQFLSLPLTHDIGYPTPGSLGTWCREQGIECITVELPRIHSEMLALRFAPLFATIINSA